jgi:hypothetical protein
LGFECRNQKTKCQSAREALGSGERKTSGCKERKRKYEAYAALLGPNDRARGLASFPTIDHARARHLSQLVYRRGGERSESKGFKVYFTYRPFGVEPPRARQKQPQNDTKSSRTTQWTTFDRLLLNTCETLGCHSSNRAHKKSVRRGFSFSSPCCPLTFVPEGPPLCHVLIFRTAVMRRQIIPFIPIPVPCANRHGDLDDCTAGCGFAGGRHDVVSACCCRVVSDGGGPNLQLLFFIQY